METKMVIETLKRYLETYQQERNELVLKDDEQAIRELVENYEREVRANFADKKAKDIATKDSEIIAIEILIKRIESDDAKKRELENSVVIKTIEPELAELVADDSIETNIAEETENVLGDVDLASL